MRKITVETFAESYGDQVVKLDALPPDELERIVAGEVERSGEEPEEVRTTIDRLVKKKNED